MRGKAAPVKSTHPREPDTGPMFTPQTRNADRYLFNRRGYGSHQAMLDLVDSGSRVLDVGAGTGELAHALRLHRDADVLAVEQDSEACAALAVRGFEVIQDDISSQRTIEKLRGVAPFDFVVCGDVLEHLVDPQHVLRQLRQTLRANGRFVVSLPNIVSLRARLKLLMGRWEYAETGIFDRTHLRFFTPASAEQLLTGAGLRVTDAIPIGPLTFRFGAPGVRLSRARPGVLATQMVFRARMVDEPVL